MCVCVCVFADVDECGNNNGGCSQLCVNEEPGFSCDCMENFELDNDGRTCKRKSHVHLLEPVYIIVSCYCT